MDIIEALGIRFPLVIAHIVAFLAVMTVFKFFLFDPVRAHVRRREKELGEQRRAVLAAEAQLEAKRRQLAERRAEIEREAYERTQALVREGAKRRNELIARARERAHEELELARREVAKARAQTFERMYDDVSELARSVITSVTATGFDLEGCEGAIAEAARAALNERSAA